MTDETKIKALHAELDKKIRSPKVPNDWNGTATIEAKVGGAVDVKIVVKI